MAWSAYMVPRRNAAEFTEMLEYQRSADACLISLLGIRLVCIPHISPLRLTGKPFFYPCFFAHVLQLQLKARPFFSTQTTYQTLPRSGASFLVCISPLARSLGLIVHRICRTLKPKVVQVNRIPCKVEIPGKSKAPCLLRGDGSSVWPTENAC